MGYIYTDTAEGLAAIGQTDILKSFATSLGLSNPLAKYEPGLTPQQVWVKYDIGLSRYPEEVNQLRSASAQRDMREKLDPILRLRAEVAPAFAPGAVAGERDVAKLADIVQMVRNFRRDMNEAKKRVGTAGAAPSPLTAAARPPAARRPLPSRGGAFPILPVAIGAGALLLVMLLRK